VAVVAVLMFVYFAAIVLGSGFFLWRARNHTAIYSIDVETMQTALGRVFERLGHGPCAPATHTISIRTNSLKKTQ